MGDIHTPSNYGSGGPETGALIHCVNGRETQIHELLCWDIDGIFREVHPTVRVDIPSGTVGEFVTENLSENGWCNQIFGELSINGSVKCFRLYQICGRELSYIVNLWAHVEATGWVSSSNGNLGSSTPDSGIVTGIWGVRFSHSNMNWSLNLDGSINASTADLLWSPIFHVLFKPVPTNISCTAGTSSVCGASSIKAIPGFVGKVKIETSPMVQQPNNYLSESLFLV